MTIDKETLEKWARERLRKIEFDDSKMRLPPTFSQGQRSEIENFLREVLEVSTI